MARGAIQGIVDRGSVKKRRAASPKYSSEVGPRFCLYCDKYFAQADFSTHRWKVHHLSE
jgi:hypothetical protein